MCIICVKAAGVRAPDKKLIDTMFEANPDGAGVVVARAGARGLEICKGYASCDEYLDALDALDVKDDDAALYHFRIATQARQLEMCHPFMVTRHPEITTARHLTANGGVACAHNGVIRLTSDGDTEYSDTALFITRYLSRMLAAGELDLKDKNNMEAIEKLAPGNRFAFLTAGGHIYTIGNFIEDRGGLKFSNLSYMGRRPELPKAPKGARELPKFILGSNIWDSADGWEM